MLEWLRQRFAGKPEVDPVDPEEALGSLRIVTSDATFEVVWEAMDGCAPQIEEEVSAAIRTKQFGEYPLHAATIWLGYTMGAGGRRLPEDLEDQLVASIAWAMGFDENTVLLGGALGALDSLDPAAREAAALRIFEIAGPGHARRYWLLLKVRSDAMMTVVVEALTAWRSESDGADPADEEYVYSPTAANRMAGAFRQFRAEDFDLVARHFDLDNAGAQFLVEALGATQSPAALELLERAAEDPRPTVSETAQRWLRQIQR